MASGAWKKGGSHHCAECGAGERFIRRCGKPLPEAWADDEPWLRGEQARAGRLPDPDHAEACARLFAEEGLGGEVGSWFGDAGLFADGHLLVRGGIEDQPSRWLAAQQVIQSARAEWLDAERKRAGGGGGEK